MVQVSVVTSFSKAGWEQYGRRFLDTFHTFWPREVDLHLVSEDDISLGSTPYAGRNITQWDLYDKSTIARAFHERHKNNSKARGKGGTGTLAARHQGYSFRHDAYKFSKKVFAIELVARVCKDHILIWLDADTVTFQCPPLEMLQRMPPGGYAVACLLRGRYHTECGFVGYDLRRQDARLFVEYFANLYASDKVFELQEWHDSWVFDWARKQMRVPTFGIPHRSASHPFVHSELGRYMDHLKGARKQNGVSHDHPRYQKKGSEAQRMMEEHAVYTGVASPPHKWAVKNQRFK